MSKKTNNPTPTLPSRLVIIPCGQGKIWDKSPNTGPTPARHAYTGAPFKMHKCGQSGWISSKRLQEPARMIDSRIEILARNLLSYSLDIKTGIGFLD